MTFVLHSFSGHHQVQTVNGSESHQCCIKNQQRQRHSQKRLVFEWHCFQKGLAGPKALNQVITDHERTSVLSVARGNSSFLFV